MDINPTALCLSLRSDLSGVLNQTELESGCPRPEANPRQYAAVALLTSILKKYSPGEVTAQQKAAAFESFKTANERCGTWTPKYDDLRDEYLLGELRECVYRFFHIDGYRSILDWKAAVLKGLPGPGSANGVDGTGFYTKVFDSALTTTSDFLYDMYRSGLRQDLVWTMADQARAQIYGTSRVVKGSKQFFVPKNVDTARMAATEPSLNMFLQKGIACSLEERLKTYFSIDLRTQPLVNRKLAEMGSVDGSFATLDLSSASDSLSLNLVRWLVPKESLYFLERTRSEVMECEDGSEMRLNMVSTMGNGFTFPLETLVFACIVEAVYRLYGIPLKKSRVIDGRVVPGNFAVFGDDIIVVKRAQFGVIRLLELCGFVVNSSKSHVEGPFRESCGGDYLLGSPVRGVYIKSLETREHVYIAINSLIAWSTQHDIPLYATIGLLYRALPKHMRLLVPVDYPEDAGIRVSHRYGTDHPSVERRFNEKSQSIVYYIRYRRAEIVRTKVLISRCSILSSLGIQFLKIAKDNRDRVSFSANEAGLYLTFLGGYMKNCSWSRRSLAPSYRTEISRDPGWGPTERPNENRLRSWETMADRILHNM